MVQPWSMVPCLRKQRGEREHIGCDREGGGAYRRRDASTKSLQARSFGCDNDEKMSGQSVGLHKK